MRPSLKSRSCAANCRSASFRLSSAVVTLALHVGERLGLVDVGLDLGEKVARLHDGPFPHLQADDAPRDGRLHVHLRLRIDDPDFADRDLQVLGRDLPEPERGGAAPCRPSPSPGPARREVRRHRRGRRPPRRSGSTSCASDSSASPPAPDPVPATPVTKWLTDRPRSLANRAIRRQMGKVQRILKLHPSAAIILAKDMAPESEKETRWKRVDPLLRAAGWSLASFKPGLDSSKLARTPSAAPAGGRPKSWRRPSSRRLSAVGWFRLRPSWRGGRGGRYEPAASLLGRRFRRPGSGRWRHCERVSFSFRAA